MSKQTDFIDSSKDDFINDIKDFADSSAAFTNVVHHISYNSIGDYLAIIQNRLTLIKKKYKNLEGKL